MSKITNEPGLAQDAL